MNENLIPGLERSLAIFRDFGVGDTHFIYREIQAQIEREKSKDSESGTVYGTLANNPPLDTKLTS
mgnify:CR=1 FL=1